MTATVAHPSPRPSKAGTRGLSQDAARRRLAEFGPNVLPESESEPAWRRLLRQFQSPLIYILLFALLVDGVVWWGSGAHGVPGEALAITTILALNAGLGAWQEWKAEDALARLKQLAAPHAWTLRDGELARIPCAELVPGDVVRLDAGDRVPADLTARETENVLADESILTGESFPVEKEAGAPLYAGTLVASGSVYGEVERTGPASAMGRLAAGLRDVEEEQTPLERRLGRFGKQVAQGVLVLAVVIAVAGVAVEGISQVHRVLMFAVALAVAAVPEGLPAVLTLALTLGVERMARRRAVVRKLAAVEALGSVTVIVADKTGTLTENQLTVRDVESPDPARAIRAMVLASSAQREESAADPLERALLRHARESGHDPQLVKGAHPRVSSRAFDSAHGFSRTTVDEAGTLVSYLKGAPEVVLERCDLSPADRRFWLGEIEDRAHGGYRVLGLAWGERETEQGLHWLGVVSLWDPPRPEVPTAVQQARDAGVRVIMVTGDHPATALTVARSVGVDATTFVSGSELAGLSGEDLRRAVREVNVFARARPEQKLAIVEALQADGQIVAVTGDGVNDAPALKRADVGVAMGTRGSDVSREVADLVLLDDNFATIVAAIEEGRSIYANIEKFIRFLFATNFSEILIVIMGVAAAFLFGLRDAAGALFLPLTAAQLLWINLVTDGAPALALTLDRNPGVMRRPPRPPERPLLDASALRFVVIAGLAMALVGLGIVGFLVRAGESLPETRTALFVFLAIGQLFFAYAARRTDARVAPSLAVHGAVIAGFVLQMAVIALPGFRQAFDAVPLSVVAWVSVAVGVLLAWASAEAVNRTHGTRVSQSS